MATCSSYGSSPSSLYFNDWMLGSIPYDWANNEIGVIKPDPIELFEDLNHFSHLPSIESDIQKIESHTELISMPLSTDCGRSSPIDIKPEINTDCMWSGSISKMNTNSAASSFSDSVVNTAVPLAVISGNTQNITNNLKTPTQQQQTQKVQQRNTDSSNNSDSTLLKIKEEPLDDYEQQLQQHSIPNNKQQQQSMQHIPPGTSLLRKSNATTQQQKKLQVQPQQQKIVCNINGRMTAITNSTVKTIKIATTKAGLNNQIAATTTTITAENTATSPTKYARPDTPHSLEDDDITTEFKHNIDLRACLMGSNNISLTADPTNYINHVSQELQDTSKNQIDMRYVAGCNSLAEVLDVIDKDNPPNRLSQGSTTNTNAVSRSNNCTSNTAPLRYITYESEEEDDDEEEVSSIIGSQYDTNSMDDVDISYEATSPVPSQASSRNSNSSCHRYQQPYIMHSDHSYTRSKDGIDDILGPNLETPSDSDEEIDVVSIGDKKLPTNPSDRDRRALQTKVAYKFSNAHIVKTANGLRTIPPRRRVSFDMPYTPASSSPVKSVVNSRYPSPASTPYQSQYTTVTTKKGTQQIVTVQQDGSSTFVNGSTMADKTRKRLANGMVVNSAGQVIEYSMPPNKKHRGKKPARAFGTYIGSISLNTTTPATGSIPISGSSIKRQFSLDEADTIEKRNLHNDMERQRRIGLKNLFESLKKQIPSIKDKERAPKVNILREATKLCEQLTREDKLLTEQKAQLKEEVKKKQELLARLRAVHQED